MHKSNLSPLTIAFLMGCSATACQDSVPAKKVVKPEAYEQRAATAIVQHLQGVEGDDEAAEEALQALSLLNTERPEDVRVQAYLGSARVLKAKRVFLPWEKGATCKEGLTLLDGAVKAQPENEELRFLRAVSTRPLPAFFGRADSAAQDFAWLAKRAPAAVDSGTLTPLMAAMVYLYHGDYRKAESDLRGARVAWKAATEVAPDSEPARSAAQRLDSLATSQGK
jgi:hypothetical protein